VRTSITIFYTKRWWETKRGIGTPHGVRGSPGSFYLTPWPAMVSSPKGKGEERRRGGAGWLAIEEGAQGEALRGEEGDAGGREGGEGGGHTLLDLPRGGGRACCAWVPATAGAAIASPSSGQPFRPPSHLSWAQIRRDLAKKPDGW
jgi:hypothetical protein